ncbi:hypothetical protein HYW99_00050 [Candidatus Woesearchaeota archaeon]|nr:hypothetical protein [Candidatus Woesearchaeota archaeon]
MEKFSKKFNLYNIFVGVAILLGVVLIINISLTYSLNKELKKVTQATEEKLKPAEIELIVIRNSKCGDCSDISAVVQNIKNSNFNITRESTLEFNSKEARELISKYMIEKVPTIALTGEIEKINIPGFEKRSDSLIMTSINPPYTNAANGRVEGRVTLYYLSDTECEKCSNLNLLVRQIKQAGVKIYEEINLNVSSEQGRELAKKYNIDFAPAIILSNDASVYSVIQQAWPQVGTKENDGYYVLRLLYPPYINLTTGKLMGLVTMTYLIDKSCVECYNVTLHKDILVNPQSFAIMLDAENIIDISDTKGKELIAKYNITLVPTAILSSEASVYPSSRALTQFFSVEKDGSFVFRKAELLGTYKDLTTNQVVKPQQNNEQ